jgi:hypothetical protein
MVQCGHCSDENPSKTEEARQREQLEAFVSKTEPHSMTLNWIMRLNPYRYARPKPKSLNIDNVPSNLVLPLQKGLVHGYAGGRPARAKVGRVLVPSRVVAFCSYFNGVSGLCYWWDRQGQQRHLSG